MPATTSTKFVASLHALSKTVNPQPRTDDWHVPLLDNGHISRNSGIKNPQVVAGERAIDAGKNSRMVFTEDPTSRDDDGGVREPHSGCQRYAATRDEDRRPAALLQIDR